jgi:methylmalonyl-CoA mutase N-terminal domain/subunit
MRERYGADDRSCRLRFHTQTGGSTLTAQQPLNNVARVTLQALAATLGGTQSLHTNAYDEALALPSEESVLVALRTQQILAHESGITHTVDPLGGSYFVEALTNRVEDEAEAYLQRIDEMGGASRAVEFMKEEIHEAAYRFQMEVEAGKRSVVGVNAFAEEGAAARIDQPDYPTLEAAQKAAVRALKTSRDDARVRGALNEIREAARSDANLLPPLIRAVKEEVTLGEISDLLREEWGTYDQG